MSWDELEKRRTADIVNRRFGVSAEETVFVRDGYELTRYLLQCACRGRCGAPVRRTLSVNTSEKERCYEIH